MIKRLGIVTLFFVATIVVAACRGGDYQSHSAADLSIEQQLAFIDGKNNPKADDPEVRRFRALLETLSKKYPQSRQQIADQTVRAWEMLDEKGIQVALIEIMEGLNQATASNSGRQDYSEHLAVYLTLRSERSFGHGSAVDALKGMMIELGNL